MAKRQKRSPYVTAAMASSVVKFNPERSALLELLRQAEDSYKAGVANARGSAQGAIAAVDRARPVLQQVYQDAGLQNPAAAAPALPAGAVDFAGAQQYEAQAAQHRLADESARALADLAQQRASAAAAVPYGVAQAKSQLEKSQGQIGRRLLALAQEEGAYAASTASDLQDKASQRSLTRRGQDITAQNSIRSTSQSERNSLRSAGIDPSTGQPIPNGPLDTSKAKKKSPFTHEQRVTTARSIRGAVETLSGFRTRFSVETAKHALLYGVPDPDSGKLLLQPILKDPFLAQAAAERYAYGGVNATTNKRLKKQYGVSAKPRAPKAELKQALHDAGHMTPIGG